MHVNGLSAYSIFCGRQSSDMLRAFVGEREAAAEDAMHCAQLWMGCLKPVEECTARKTSHGRRKGFVSTLAVSSV